MNAFESLLLLLLAAVLLAAAARRVKVPYPAFLALGGAVLGFFPHGPGFQLDPSLALALFVAPVLLDAAYDASPRDLKGNWVPLATLVIGAVALTTVAVAWVAHTLVPSMPWAAAVALGAVVAPPDAAAASAVLKQLRPPHRILTILEGESLLNDAIALLLFRLAVGAVVTREFAFTSIAPAFLLAVVGSAVVGPILGVIVLRLTRRVRDVPTSVILQFISTFGVWILAERIGLSAVLTMVCYAVTVSRRAPAWTPARLRVPSYAVWETVVFVLNVLAFVFIGLQIRPILAALDSSTRTRYLVVAGAVLLTVVVVRFVWVMLCTAVMRVAARSRGHGFVPSVGGSVVVAWAGMRGIVTLAAALALPALPGGGEFPHRDLIVLSSFCVVLGTLLLQGLTLRPLLQVLALRDDDPVAREVARARARTLRSAIASLDGDTSQAALAVRAELEARLQISGGREAAAPRTPHDRLRRRAVATARRELLQMRDETDIGDDAFHVVEEELDWLEMSGTVSGPVAAPPES